jgi:hypothetical protein
VNDAVKTQSVTKFLNLDSMQKHDNKMIGIVEPEEFLLHARVMMMRRQMDRSGGGSAVES